VNERNLQDWQMRDDAVRKLVALLPRNDPCLMFPYQETTR
jgi:hypothetical protein